MSKLIWRKSIKGLINAREQIKNGPTLESTLTEENTIFI